MADFKISVQRFDPSVDDAPHLVEYDVPWIDDDSNIVTGLQVLKYINENIEPLVFDSCCYCSTCGRCAMMIDGKPALACFTPLMPGAHTFEPLRGFSVVRDLVVEHDRAYDKLVSIMMENQTVDPITELCDYDHNFYYDVLDRVNSCRECFCCYAACPALQERSLWEEFAGPAALAHIGLRHMDGRDQSDRVLQAVNSGVFQCDLCGACSEVCPSHIDFIGIVYGLQAAARERGLVPANAVEPHYGVGDDVPPVAYEGSDAEGVLNSGTCSMPTCHDITTMGQYKRSAEEAQLRIDSHVRKHGSVTEEQAASLLQYFTKA